MRLASRSALIAAVFLLAAAACRGDGAGATSASSAPSAGPTAAGSEADDSRLLIHDEAGTIYTVAPDGGDRIEIAAPPDDGTNSQPAWSPAADRVAWVATAGAETSLVVSAANGDLLASARLPTEAFYIFWSPDGRRMVVLAPAAGGSGIDVWMAEVGDDRLDVEVIDAGSPYYFDWSPQSDRYFLHVGPGVLMSVDIGGSRVVRAEAPAAFAAPAWDGDSLLYAVSRGGIGGTLVVEDATSGDVTEAVRFTGLIFFDVAAGRVAYQVSGPDDGVDTIPAALGLPVQATPNRLAVYDLATGEHLMVTSGPSVAFSWSPDGARLAYLTPVSGGLFRWSVWDGDRTVDFAPFRLKRLYLRDYLPFFDQYARSSTMWAPDSSAFAFAGGLLGGPTGVFVQPVAEGAEPVLVGEGDHVTWSSGP